VEKVGLVMGLVFKWGLEVQWCRLVRNLWCLD